MCLNFLVVKIGCDNDNTIKIDTTVLTEVMNNIDQQFVNSSGSDTITFQELTFTNAPGGIVRCNNLTVGQTNNITSTTLNSFNNQQLATINTDITNKVEDRLTQSQTQGILNFLNNISQAGSLTNSQDITNEVKNIVRNTVRETAINTLWTGINTSQEFTVLNQGTIEGDTCNFVQENLLNIRITNLAQNIQQSLLKNQFMNNLLIYSKQSQESGTLRWLIIAAIVIAALIIIGIILYLLFGGSKTAVKPEQLAGLVKPEVRLCAAEAKAKLAAEGRAGDRNAELFMIERCVSEKKAQERFRSQPESFSRREVGGSGGGGGGSGEGSGEGGGGEALSRAGGREGGSGEALAEGPVFSERMRGYARRFMDRYRTGAAEVVE